MSSQRSTLKKTLFVVGGVAALTATAAGFAYYYYYSVESEQEKPALEEENLVKVKAVTLGQSKKVESKKSLNAKDRTAHVKNRTAMFENLSSEKKGKNQSSKKKKKKKKKGAKLVVAAPKCPVCKKTAYAAESVVYGKDNYHQRCWKCSTCKRKLVLSSMTLVKGKLSCKPCFENITIKPNVDRRKSITSGISRSDTNFDDFEGADENDKSVEARKKKFYHSLKAGELRDRKTQEKIKAERKKHMHTLTKEQMNEASKNVNKVLKNKEKNTKEYMLAELEKQTQTIIEQMKNPNNVSETPQEKGKLNLNGCNIFQKVKDSELEQLLKEKILAQATAVGCTKLSIANASLKDDSAIVIAKWLQSEDSSKITELNLESNQIRGKGLVALGEALTKNTVLTSLKLQNQRSAPSAALAKEFLDALEKNTTLVKLGFQFQKREYNRQKDKYLTRNLNERRKLRKQKNEKQQVLVKTQQKEQDNQNSNVLKNSRVTLARKRKPQTRKRFQPQNPN